MELREIENSVKGGLTPIVEPAPKKKREAASAKADAIANRSREFQHVLETEKCDPAVIVARVALGKISCHECGGKGKLRYRRQRGGKLVFDPDPKAPKSIGIVACLHCKGSGREPVETNQILNAAVALLPFRFPRLKHMEHVRANLNLTGSMTVVQLAALLNSVPEEGGQLLPPQPKPLPEGDL